MARTLRKALRKWLLAERRGVGPAAAERALREVFRALPAPAPPSGFVARVMARAGLAARRPVPLGWRLGLAAGMALAAMASAMAPGVVLGVAARLRPGTLLRWGAGALVEGCQRLAEGLAIWQALGSAGETISRVLAAPPTLATLVAATLLSATALRMLYGLVSVERSTTHARTL